jgi:hypothetical protein
MFSLIAMAYIITSSTAPVFVGGKLFAEFYFCVKVLYKVFTHCIHSVAVFKIASGSVLKNVIDVIIGAARAPINDVHVM